MPTRSKTCVTWGTKRALEAGALREELNQSVKTAFERNNKVLGIWLSFEPNGLDGKDSEFIDDKARVSNEKGRFSSLEPSRWRRPEHHHGRG